MFISQESFVVQRVSVYVGSACVAGWIRQVPAGCWRSIQLCAVSAWWTQWCYGEESHRVLWVVKNPVLTRGRENSKSWNLGSCWLLQTTADHASWARRTFHKRIIQVPTFASLGHSWTYLTHWQRALNIPTVASSLAKFFPSYYRLTQHSAFFLWHET